MQKTLKKYLFTGDACIRGMMSGLATHTKAIQEQMVVGDKDRRPQEHRWRCTASVSSKSLWSETRIKDPKRTPGGALLLRV